jgi:gamma-glutamyltranspeptidase/glutathione hydrolase
MLHRTLPRVRAAAGVLALISGLLCGCEAPVPAHQKEAASAPRPSAQPPPAPTAPTAPPAPSAPTAPTAEAAPTLPLPPAPDPPIKLKGGGKRAVRGEAGLVTSVDANATRAGVDVLRRGGNAVDAAVAVAFALAVTQPSAGNIGGGGFMIVRLAGGETHAIDFREMAPAAATVEKNTEQLKAGAVGYLSAAVPGTVAGMSYVAEKFGSKPLAELVAPAVALARKGHRINDRLGLSLTWNWAKLKVDPVTRGIFGDGKKPLGQGDTLKQPDLARTLEAIGKDGARAFYEGAFAEKMEKAMRANGGLVTAADLKAYKVRPRTPIRFSYRGFTVDTMGPPSMGGVGFAAIMLLLERYRAYEAPVDSGLSLHSFIEASKRVYAQRRRIGADPDFMPPETTSSGLAMLLDGDALQRLSPPMKPDRATPSSEITPVPGTPAEESPQTTHFSVVDAFGNAVSATVTQSAAFGSKVVIPGTGVLLSNAMGAFSESGVNTLAPGKRMSSSMSPSIVTQNGRLVLVLGSPGGDTIPGTVAQVFRNLVDYGMTIDEAIERGRAHHPWIPDRVRVEKQRSLPKSALEDLVSRGHVIEKGPFALGDAKGILIDEDGIAWGYADSREGGKAEGLAAAAVAAATKKKNP